MVGRIKLKEWQKFFLMGFIFILLYFLPVEILKFRNPFYEALALVKWYAREHVLLCLVPAFFIAGGISVFISQASILKYFGPKANKILAYCVASVSGTILAVCSCTVLPLFSGIYKRGAGLGPAIAFLYSGPAINVLAIIMTARILGWQLGLARAICAIIMSVVVGLLMHLFFIKEEIEKHNNSNSFVSEENDKHPLWQIVLQFAFMIAFLVFANWAEPKAGVAGLWANVFQIKWLLSAFSLLGLFFVLKFWYDGDEIQNWTGATWVFAKQITPLLLIGVFIAGFLLGRPGYEGIIPSKFVSGLVGGNSLSANFFASIVGAFMYFATLTEVPILQGLIGSGMGKGPALALLLAGPALSLPSMLVLKNVMGTKKTVVYVFIVVIISTFCGIVFGNIVK
ncbi:MAG TPA: permease [bacterium]|nr:permease [bacterium]HOL49497.1 permease [bacterium]HPO52240.1 permease [bacterium]